MKDKMRGRPKKEQTKKHFNLRLSDDVISFIKSNPNQVAYIESLVRSDNNIVTKTKEGNA